MTIDPLVCPRGHHSIYVNAQRFNCQTCRNQGHETTSWDRSELVDLRYDDPQLVDDLDPDPDLEAFAGGEPA